MCRGGPEGHSLGLGAGPYGIVSIIQQVLRYWDRVS